MLKENGKIKEEIKSSNIYTVNQSDCMLLSCHVRDSEWIYTL